MAEEKLPFDRSSTAKLILKLIAVEDNFINSLCAIPLLGGEFVVNVVRRGTLVFKFWKKTKDFGVKKAQIRLHTNRD